MLIAHTEWIFFLSYYDWLWLDYDVSSLWFSLNCLRIICTLRYAAKKENVLTLIFFRNVYWLKILVDTTRVFWGEKPMANERNFFTNFLRSLFSLYHFSIRFVFRSYNNKSNKLRSCLVAYLILNISSYYFYSWTSNIFFFLFALQILISIFRF